MEKSIPLHGTQPFGYNMHFIYNSWHEKIAMEWINRNGKPGAEKKVFMPCFRIASRNVVVVLYIFKHKNANVKEYSNE